MSIEAWQVDFDRARAAVGSADERFQAVDQELSRQLTNSAAQPIQQADHERWLAAKEALDKANAEWTVIARLAPVKPSTSPPASE
jgi:cellulase/cellobiase CelA1